MKDVWVGGWSASRHVCMIVFENNISIHTLNRKRHVASVSPESVRFLSYSSPPFFRSAILQKIHNGQAASSMRDIAILCKERCHGMILEAASWDRTASLFYNFYSILMVYGCLWWFMDVYGDSWWFMDVYGHVCWFNDVSIFPIT